MVQEGDEIIIERPIEDITGIVQEVRTDTSGEYEFVVQEADTFAMIKVVVGRDGSQRAHRYGLWRASEDLGTVEVEVV